jgi:hypothetical protein
VRAAAYTRASRVARMARAPLARPVTSRPDCASAVAGPARSAARRQAAQAAVAAIRARAWPPAPLAAWTPDSGSATRAAARAAVRSDRAVAACRAPIRNRSAIPPPIPERARPASRAAVRARRAALGSDARPALPVKTRAAPRAAVLANHAARATHATTVVAVSPADASAAGRPARRCPGPTEPAARVPAGAGRPDSPVARCLPLAPSGGGVPIRQRIAHPTATAISAFTVVPGERSAASISFATARRWCAPRDFVDREVRTR